MIFISLKVTFSSIRAGRILYNTTPAVGVQTWAVESQRHYGITIQWR